MLKLKNNLICVLCIIFGMLLIVSSAFCEFIPGDMVEPEIPSPVPKTVTEGDFSEEEFVYNDNEKRDPFVPLITDSVRFGAGLVGIGSIDDITLEGIVWDPVGESLVILNGMILKEYEQVNNIKIVSIESKKITISIDKNVFTINLIKDEE